MIVLASVLIVVILGAVTGLRVAAIRRQRIVLDALVGIRTALEGQADPLFDALKVRLDDLERSTEDLPRKWEAIKREASAAEARARYHARRALDELEEHGLTSPGLESVAGELFGNDDQEGRGELVPAVPESVAADEETPDYLALANRRKYGDHRND